MVASDRNLMVLPEPISIIEASYDPQLDQILHGKLVPIVLYMGAHYLVIETIQNHCSG